MLCESAGLVKSFVKHLASCKSSNIYTHCVPLRLSTTKASISSAMSTSGTSTLETFTSEISDTMTAAAVAASPLFELSGELRNRIYLSVLCENDWLNITDEGIEEIGLLRVCHIIRAEALPIFEGENLFCLWIEKHDSTTLHDFHAKLLDARKYRIGFIAPDLHTTVSSKVPHRPNLNLGFSDTTKKNSRASDIMSG